MSLSLVDYPDKNLAIIPVEDWPYFVRYRQAARQHAKTYPEMEALIEQVRAHIHNHGAISSDDLKLEGNFTWQSAIHWSSGNNSSRSVLEQMYSTGELIIHLKKGTRNYYDIAGKYIKPNLLNAPEPREGEHEHQKWRVLRRIGAVSSAAGYTNGQKCLKVTLMKKTKDFGNNCRMYFWMNL